MFTVKMDGKTAIVSRTLDLPASGILKPFKLESKASRF